MEETEPKFPKENRKQFAITFGDAIVSGYVDLSDLWLKIGFPLMLKEAYTHPISVLMKLIDCIRETTSPENARNLAELHTELSKILKVDIGIAASEFIRHKINPTPEKIDQKPILPPIPHSKELTDNPQDYEKIPYPKISWDKVSFSSLYLVILLPIVTSVLSFVSPLRLALELISMILLIGLALFLIIFHQMNPKFPLNETRPIYDGENCIICGNPSRRRVLPSREYCSLRCLLVNNRAYPAVFSVLPLSLHLVVGFDITLRDNPVSYFVSSLLVTEFFYLLIFYGSLLDSWELRNRYFQFRRDQFVNRSNRTEDELKKILMLQKKKILSGSNRKLYFDYSLFIFMILFYIAIFLFVFLTVGLQGAISSLIFEGGLTKQDVATFFTNTYLIIIYTGSYLLFFPMLLTIIWYWIIMPARNYPDGYFHHPILARKFFIDSKLGIYTNTTGFTPTPQNTREAEFVMEIIIPKSAIGRRVPVYFPFNVFKEFDITPKTGAHWITNIIPDKIIPKRKLSFLCPEDIQNGEVLYYPTIQSLPSKSNESSSKTFVKIRIMNNFSYYFSLILMILIITSGYLWWGIFLSNKLIY